jgi:hypothetical protein
LDAKKDFFISYTKSDEEWAVWIDETLKNTGHSTILQVCDRGMEDKVELALRNSECFIAVLSKEYHDSPSCLNTWTPAFGKYTSNSKNITDFSAPVKPLFIPVKIDDFVLEASLLLTINYVPLYEHDKKSLEAQKMLLDAIKPRPFDRPVELNKKPDFTDKKDIINNLPFPRNPYFSGRIEILDSIYKNLNSNGMVSLIQSDSSLNGIGKTAISLEYAYLHKNEYETIWWVNAASPSDILMAYRDLAIHKQIISDNAKEKDIVEAMKNWFNNNKKWLFIFDNANKDDFKWLEVYLPQSLQSNKKTHILITTRNSFFPKCKSSIDIPVFNETEAISFLKKRADKSGEDYSDEWAKKLAEYIQYVPLALEQAAVYIEQMPGVTYQDCIALIIKYGTDVFKKQLLDRSKQKAIIMRKDNL